MTKPVTSRVVSLPAPTGLNLLDNPASLQPGECLVMRNLIRGENGTRTRSGSEPHYGPIGVGGYLTIRSIFGFEGSSADQDRLFATTYQGIWDVTTESHRPTTPSETTSSGGTLSVLERVTPSVDMRLGVPVMNTGWNVNATSAGYGVASAFTTLAGEHYLYYADEGNGLYLYTESTRAWTKMAAGTGAGQIDGVDPADIAFVTVWKKRVWFVKRNSTLAYYLPVNQYAGTVQTFDFGPQFKHGGHLVGLWSWTLDAGVGMDDRIVAISSSGDVVIYEGTDPDYFPEIRLKGVWFVGKVPTGRKIATEYGGDLLILSSLGVVPLSKIVTGAPLSDPGLYATRNIAPAFTARMSEQLADWTGTVGVGWETAIHPRDGVLVVMSPVRWGTSDVYRQYVMSLATGAWSESTMLMTCATSWHGDLYFGTHLSYVLVNRGSTDYEPYATYGTDPNGTTHGITSYAVYGFQAGNTGNTKRLLMARAYFLNGATPEHILEGRANFDVSVPTPTTTTFTAGDYSQPGWRGISGIGPYLSVGISMYTTTQANLAGVDVLVEPGGVL